MVIITSPVAVETQPLLLDVTNTTLTVTSQQFDRLCSDRSEIQ